MAVLHSDLMPGGQDVERMTPCSALTVSESLYTEFRERDSDVFGLWVPSIRWPKIHPIPAASSGA